MEERPQHSRRPWSLRRKLGLTAWFYILSILVNVAVSSGFILLYFRPAFRESNVVFQEQQRLEYIRALIRPKGGDAEDGLADPLDARKQLSLALILLDQTPGRPPSFGSAWDLVEATETELRTSLRLYDFDSAGELDALASKLTPAIDLLSREREASLARASQAQNWVTRLLIVNSTIGAALCLAALWFVRRWVVQPAGVLKRAAGQIREGNFHPQISLSADDEMGQLGHEMTDMAQQIARLQGQLVHRERLAAADQMIEKVEQHVREPLARIWGLANATAARSTTHEDLKPSQQRIAATVRQFEAWLAQLRTGVTCTIGEPRQVDLVAVFANVLAAVQPALDRHRVHLSAHTDSHLRSVRLDALQFEQALISLVTNAVQASCPGQAVRMSASLGDPSSGCWQIEIVDQGSGVPPDLMDKIFLPFFTTKTDGNGIGLGLVKSIVEQHGGDLSVTSSPGQGSRFAIRLPVCLPETTGGAS